MMAGVRGISWRREETQDLLTLWGEKKVQDALRQTYRNIDTFEEIARGMAERGHKRTAIECRTKTKGLRLEYKRTLLHNSTSGNAKATCPFYEELHGILHGDASMQLRREANSFRLQNVPLGNSNQTPNPTPSTSQELFTPSTEASKEAGEAMPYSPRPSGLSPERVPNRRDLDAPIVELEPKPGPSTTSQAMGRRIPKWAERDPDDVPSGAVLVERLPSSRLAVIRAKRKWTSTLQRIGERLLHQAAREHTAMMEAGRQEHEQFLEELRACREEERLSRELLDEMMGVSLATLSKIAKAITRHREEAHQPMENRPQDTLEPREGPSTSGAGRPSHVVPAPPSVQSGEEC